MKCKISRAVLLAFGVLLKSAVAFAQVGTLTQVPANQSPQAASLGKFVEMPVGLYTGTPNINVPLYNLPVHELNIPISLSYNASGLKIKDVAGQVGTGFSLNAGGVITRVVRGYPDHYNDFTDATEPYSYFDTLKNKKILKASSEGMESTFGVDDRQHILLSVPGVRAENLAGYPFLYWARPLDTEMDIFYFNFLGYSGVFTFTNDGEALILSGTKDLKISYTYGKYKITDAEGVEFYFNDREYAYMNYGNNIESKYTASWCLSKIYLPTHKASVDFRYRQYTNARLYQKEFLQDYDQSYFSTTNMVKWFDNTVRIGSGTIGGSGCLPYSAHSSLNYPNQLSTSLFISEISWNDNKISFYGDTTRTDVYKYKLDSIKVKCVAETVSTIKFNYNYFNAASTELAKKRLQLKDVYINDAHYRFDYIDSLWGRGTPSLYAKGYDIWGYYNGEDDEDVIPFYKLFKSGMFPDYNYYIHNANSAPKNSDYKWAQLGTLKSITYPTGGQTLFEYEGNEYSKVGFLSGQTNIESDSYTQIELDSTGYKNVSTYTKPRTTNYSEFIRREFVVHANQTSNINIKMGMTYQDVSYAAYVDTVYGWWGSASAFILKFNDVTNVFDTIWTHSVLPKDSIGLPSTVAAYNNLKAKARTNAVRTIALPEGRYRVDLMLNGFYLDGDIGIEVKFPYKKDPGIYYAAGLRLKKVQFVSNTTTDTSYVKRYNYMADSISSGVLESPFGNISKSFYWGGYHTISSGVSYQDNCGFVDFTSAPSIPLGNAQGGVIGYSKVAEIREDQAKTVHYFTNGASSPYWAGDYYFYSNSSIPVRTRIQYDNSWKRGLPMQVDYYDNKGTLLKQDFTQYYVIDNESYKKSVSMVIEDVILYPTAGNSLGSYTKTENYYTRSTGHSLKLSDSTVLYTPAGTLNEVTYYDYPYAAWPHDKPITITTRNSKGEYTITHLRYPQDFTSIGMNPTNPNARSIKNQISKNVLSPVIEKYQQKSDAGGSNFRTISGEYVRYDTSGTVVDSVFSLELISPLASYNEINIDSTKTLRDSQYKARIIFSKYDSGGNIAEQSKANNIKEVLLWGYKNQYPVARVIGSDYSTVSALVDTSILNNPASELQLLTELDKIRTYFATAPVQVFTYAYAPLRGMTVEVDPRGRKTTYMYDSNGRLALVKDHDGKMLKIINYSYAP